MKLSIFDNQVIKNISIVVMDATSITIDSSEFDWNLELHYFCNKSSITTARSTNLSAWFQRIGLVYNE